MKKNLFGWMVAVSALFGMGLASCQSDDNLVIEERMGYKKIHVSLTASIGGEETRATLTPEGSILKFAWEKGDAIEVINAADGEWLGKLHVTKVQEDVRECIFDGDISAPNGGCALNFYYLGKKGVCDASKENKYMPSPLMVDFSTQTGTAEELYDYDILIAQKSYESGVNGNLGKVDFGRYFSFGRFVLQIDGENLNIAGVPVTISANTGNLYSKSSLSFQSGKFKHEAGTITVTSSSENFYVNLIPSEAVNLKFTCKVGDDNFEGTIGDKLKQAFFYSNNGEPIVVEMKTVRNYGIRYHSNFDTDQTYEDFRTGVIPDEGASFVLKETYGETGLPERQGYTFKGWGATDDAGVNDVESKGTTVEIFENSYGVIHDYYAVWEKNDIEYTIRYNTGNTGTIAEQTVSSKNDEVTIELNNGSTLSNPGYEFIGWSNQENATEGQLTWTLTKENPSVELYPVWKKNTITTLGYDQGTWNN